MKTKSLWAQRFFRNPHRQPCPWSFLDCCEEVDDGRREIREDRMGVREEDMDCLTGRISSESEDMEDTEEALSVPESETGKIEKLAIEDIVQDVSKLFTEEGVENNQHDGIQVRPSMNLSTFANAFNSAGNKISRVQRGDRDERTFTCLNPNTNDTHNPCLKIFNFVEGEGDWGKDEEICCRSVRDMTHEE